jgi:predicted unusual protein kinase regulating ubiquinone biosynthesis (AarF/ABC1/UbiB family)
MKSKENKGALARGYRLGKLGFSLVGSYLGYQAQNLWLGEEKQAERRTRFQQRASRRMREELSALKGPAMKFGQLLSMQTGVLSEEAIEELARMQMRAPGMHASLARAQFKSALGKYPEELFREFDPAPFAAASLGQVHRAVTRAGEKVVVKIQYPDIRRAIENDFTLLKSATLPTRLTGYLPASLLDEIERGLLEETDYSREAENLEIFRNGLNGLAYLTIPRMYRELSADRVLTMSYVEGESLGPWLKRKPGQALRNLTGARLAEMYEMQLQRLKMIHADQHPGNYLFQPDGTIGLVDFGCVKRLHFDIHELRRCYAERSWRKGEAAARRFLAIAYGPNVPYERARKILPLIEQWLDAGRPGGSTEDIVIGKGDSKTQGRLKGFRLEHRRRMIRDKLINPEFAFMVRAEMGLLHHLTELKAVVNVSEIMRRVAALPEIDPEP